MHTEVAGRGVLLLDWALRLMMARERGSAHAIRFFISETKRWSRPQRVRSATPKYKKVAGCCTARHTTVHCSRLLVATAAPLPKSPLESQEASSEQPLASSHLSTRMGSTGSKHQLSLSLSLGQGDALLITAHIARSPVRSLVPCACCGSRGATAGSRSSGGV